MDFKGKGILITGASSGIGAVVAEHFARLGASLALVGRNVTNLNKVIESCTKVALVKPLGIVADVTLDAERIIENTINTFGQINVLINNAGFGAPSSIQLGSLDQFDSIMNTNVRAVYHLTMLAVPELIKTKGNIVNVSSLAGIRSIPSHLIYSISKSALDQFTKCVALELAPKGVRVNSVNPAVIETDFHLTNGMNAAQYSSFLDRCKETHPLGRAGQPQEVADAIVFLANDLTSSFITGTLLPVDGGRSITCPR